MKKRIPVFIALLVVAAMAVIDFTYHPMTEADAEYPLTNQMIDWTK